MKGAARFLFGALLGIALGYAFVLLTHRGMSQKRGATFVARRPKESRSERREPAEEIAAS